MRKLYILGVVGCIMVGLCILIGFVVGQLTYQPKVVEIEVPKIEYITITRDVPSEPVVIEIPVPYYITVTKEVPTETTVYRNIYPRSWSSVAKFKAWYEEQDFRVFFTAKREDGDCDDYAKDLQIEALKQGYPISQALAKSGYYYGVKVLDKRVNHAGNLVLIGEVYWWVEPNPEEFKVVKICKRDKD